MTATTLKNKKTFYKLQGDELFITNRVSASAYELALLLLNEFNFATTHGKELIFSLEKFAKAKNFSRTIRTLRTASKKLQEIGFLVKTKLGWIINPRGKICPDNFVYSEYSFDEGLTTPQNEAEVSVKKCSVSTMEPIQHIVETAEVEDRIPDVPTQHIVETAVLEEKSEQTDCGIKEEIPETMQSISEEPISFDKSERVDQLRRYGRLMVDVNPKAAESWNKHIDKGLESKTVHAECSLLIMNFFVKSCCMGEDYDTIPDWLESTGMTLSMALSEFSNRRTSHDDIRQRTSSNCANVYRVYDYKEIFCMKTFKQIPHPDSQPWQVPFRIQDFNVIEKNPYLQ